MADKEESSGVAGKHPDLNSTEMLWWDLDGLCMLMHLNGLNQSLLLKVPLQATEL